MVTETIFVNNQKSVLLHIEEINNLVHQVDVHTPNNLTTITTYYHPTGISKEEAMQRYCSNPNFTITDI